MSHKSGSFEAMTNSDTRSASLLCKNSRKWFNQTRKRPSFEHMKLSKDKLSATFHISQLRISCCAYIFFISLYLKAKQTCQPQSQPQPRSCGNSDWARRRFSKSLPPFCSKIHAKDVTSDGDKKHRHRLAPRDSG